MLFLLSPAKTLNYTSPMPVVTGTTPVFMKRSVQLVAALREFSPAALASLMTISDSLAHLNTQRFAHWSPKNSCTNSRPAVLAFDGDVYEGLQARAMTTGQLAYLQSHLYILSGLHGVLKPLDLIQPHRLEMSTRLANAHGNHLYAFWGESITDKLNSALLGKAHQTVINLASQEYFKAVKPALLKAIVITPVFEDWHESRFRVIAFHAKRARGAMMRYATMNAVTEPTQLHGFDYSGYRFDTTASDAITWRFRRKQPV